MGSSLQAACIQVSFVKINFFFFFFWGGGGGGSGGGEVRSGDGVGEGE